MCTSSFDFTLGLKELVGSGKYSRVKIDESAGVGK